jgi:hypothetical protein
LTSANAHILQAMSGRSALREGKGTGSEMCTCPASSGQLLLLIPDGTLRLMEQPATTDDLSSINDREQAVYSTSKTG